MDKPFFHNYALNRDYTQEEWWQLMREVDTSHDTEFGRNRPDTLECLEPHRVWLKDGKLYQPIDTIKPIPLTKEILERNGFVRRCSDYLWFAIVGNEYQNYICVQFRKNGTIRFVEFNFTNVINTELRTINYVHELQHALKLCRIDKTIEL